MLRKKFVAFGLAGTIGVMGWWKSDLIGDVVDYAPTPQEAWVGKTLLDAFGEHVETHCLPQESIKNRMWPFYGTDMEETQGMAADWLGVVWLDREICDNLERYARRPAEDKQKLTKSELKAIRVASHEARHIAGTDHEGQADCEALQKAGQLLTVLGTSKDDRPLIHAWLAYYVTEYPRNRPEAYNLDACHEKGPWDLDLAHSGVFPKPII